MTEQIHSEYMRGRIAETLMIVNEALAALEGLDFPTRLLVAVADCLRSTLGEGAGSHRAIRHDPEYGRFEAPAWVRPILDDVKTKVFWDGRSVNPYARQGAIQPQEVRIYWTATDDAARLLCEGARLQPPGWVAGK